MIARRTAALLLASVMLTTGGIAATSKDDTAAPAVIAANAEAAAPAQVVNVKAKMLDDSSAKLTWDKVKGAKGYRVYVYNEKTGKYKKVITIPKADKTSYKLKGLKAGKVYKYKVRAYVKDNGNTVWGKSSSAVNVYILNMLRYDGEVVKFNVPGEGNEVYETYKDLDKAVAVKSVKERDKLIKKIKKTYPESSKVVKQLKKYGKKFFKKNALIYTLTINEGADARYMLTKTDSVTKKEKNGKTTVTVATSSQDIVPNGVETNDEWCTRFSCTFTKVSKSDIKDVKTFKSVDNTGKSL